MYESRGENNRREMSVSPIRPDITVTHLHSDEREREREDGGRKRNESLHAIIFSTHSLCVCCTKCI